MIKGEKINLRVKPQSHNTQYWEAMAVYRFIRERVKGLNVLDAGCAYGYGTNLLAESAAAVMGVDFNPEVVLWAKKNYPRANIKFIFGDLEKLVLPEAHFDVVCMLEVIHQVQDYRKVLGEVSRVIKKNGFLFLSTRNYRGGVIKNFNFEHRHCLTRKEWSTLLLEYGFMVWETLGISRSEQVYRLEEELRNLRVFDFLGIRKIIPESLVSLGVYLVSKLKGITPPQELKDDNFMISAEILATSPGVFFICHKG